MKTLIKISNSFKIKLCLGLAIFIMLVWVLYTSNVLSHGIIKMSVTKNELPLSTAKECRERQPYHYKQENITAITKLDNDSPDRSRDGIIYILFWVGPFGDEPEFRIDQNLCGNCILTYDQRYLDESDAVIIHFTEAFIDKIPDPKRRKSHQMFAFYSTESPYAISTYRGFRFEEMQYYFNWTITYRRDSSIYMPFVELNRHNGVFNGETKHSYGEIIVQNIIERKQNSPYIALWMAGNCAITQGAVQRKYLIGAMEMYGLTVDKYGKCFNRAAPEGSEYFTFAAKYKFYLAFENAEHCRDYITEKLWSNSYEAGLVPVVWGPTRADIEAIAPKDSFIFYEDFQNGMAVVNYLKYLDQNPLEYRKYFNWRVQQPTPAQYMMVEHGPQYQRDVGMCKLCRLLWEKRRYNNVTSVVPSIHNWLIQNEASECVQEQFLPFLHL